MIFDLILYGENEFYKKINNKIYYTLIVNNEDTEVYMFNTIENFNIKYIGIDLEFNHVSKNEMDVALMQLNFENDIDNIGHIFIINPSKLLETNYNKLINILTKKETIKIVHGSESLDVTYFFNQLLITNENINNFCNNLYDTRYLCEYYKIKKNYDNEIKCNIYSLLLLLNIISNDKYHELEDIEEQMGPIWLIQIDINNIDIFLLKYALYDVIYLPQLLKKFLDFNNIYYNNIIPDLTILVYKYKKNIENQFMHLEKIIGKMNIYFIFINNKKYLLQEIYNIYNTYIFEDIKEINYFKNFFKIIIKFLIYYNIYNKYKIYINKKYILSNINFEFFFKWLDRYKYINSLILNYNTLLEDNL